MAAKERSGSAAASGEVARAFANASASARLGLKDDLIVALQACPEAIACRGADGAYLKFKVFQLLPGCIA